MKAARSHQQQRKPPMLPGLGRRSLKAVIHLRQCREPDPPERRESLMCNRRTKIRKRAEEYPQWMNIQKLPY